jgi:molybdopterin-guanine dinucleotide biosynthesis protein A
MTESSIAGVVLAGGDSRRMGSDKAFLEVDGEPLFCRQARILREAGAEPVLLSGRKGFDYRAAGVPVILDETPGLGPVGGILSALGNVKTQRLFVLAVDLPGMTSGFLRRLSTLSNRCVIPHTGVHWEPLAAIYTVEIGALARERIGRGQLALQGLAADLIRRGLALEYRS